MKYIMMCLGALVLCVCMGLAITIMMEKIRKKPFGKKGRIFVALGSDVVLILVVMFVYLGNYYHADDEAQLAMQGSDYVTVEKTTNGYLFDGPGESQALIFYPGAKVEAIAYTPILKELSEQGIDCFLVEMPFHMAIFGQNAAEELLDKYTYEEWTIAGHSMGGLVATNFAISHPEQVKNVVLLAAYSTKPLPETVRFLSIYGDQDGCLNRASYETGKSFWPTESTEVVIPGGNHAQMGSYGFQKGDKEATISAKDQWEEVVEAIQTFMQKK